MLLACLIRSFNEYILSVCQILFYALHTDSNPCPQKAYILVGGEYYNKYKKYIQHQKVISIMVKNEAGRGKGVLLLGQLL